MLCEYGRRIQHGSMRFIDAMPELDLISGTCDLKLTKTKHKTRYLKAACWIDIDGQATV